jgi:hypothetical protein
MTARKNQHRPSANGERQQRTAGEEASLGGESPLLTGVDEEQDHLAAEESPAKTTRAG